MTHQPRVCLEALLPGSCQNKPPNSDTCPVRPCTASGGPVSPLSLPPRPGLGDDLHSELITGLEITIVLAPCDLWFGGDTEQEEGYTPPSSRCEHVCM